MFGLVSVTSITSAFAAFITAVIPLSFMPCGVIADSKSHARTHTVTFAAAVVVPITAIGFAQLDGGQVADYLG